MVEKKCGKCGETFQCCSTIPCWCTFEKVSNERLELLKTHFDDCLCHSCLRN
ncbi:MAG: cysteine-rich CWC family protein [Thermoplasmataceae archaeon]